jgi:hypothetical protein
MNGDITRFTKLRSISATAQERSKQRRGDLAHTNIG